MRYADDQGNPRLHVFDFLVRFASGRRVAFFVKPAKWAAKPKVKAQLAALRPGFADALWLATDKCFTKAEALNAERYFHFKKTRDAALQARLEKVVATACFPVSVGDLSEQLNAGGAGYRAVVIAIYEGVLSCERRKEIDQDTLVYAGELT